ncbi:hypothetical protein JHV56_16565 [Arthrobacter sp. BHU FT2]|nr:hypothetical protein [Arthrobacter sp. BHU FT2]
MRASTTDVLISWRLLGLDPEGIGFHVYRSSNGGPAVQLTDQPLTAGTNFTDTGADLTVENRYSVREVVQGVEGKRSEQFTLSANHAIEPVVRVPLQAGAPVKYVWVGDLDGDGSYDYVLDRHDVQQSLEAYRSNGDLLWRIHMGPNSVDQDNIEGGSATLSVGNWDGVTVQDLDSDGYAEVALKVANGVTFGDGTTYTAADDSHQAIAILDGRTGSLRASAPLPADYIADGPLYARFGAGSLDGKNQSLVAFMKNRVGNGPFNLMIGTWRFDGTSLTQQWVWHRGDQTMADGHNTRIIDVDGDGKDEIAEIGFVLNGDGTLRYSLRDQGIIHGDRFYIADIDPARPGLEGYGIQQDNPSGLREYYYDASTGSMLWQHSGDDVVDVGRGLVADIDPRFPGLEAWSFEGLYNAGSNSLTEPDTSLSPWPQFSLWWDGDLGAELLNDRKIEKWNPEDPRTSNRLPRLISTGQFGAVNSLGSTRNPTFVGDILGDWREEVVYTNATFNELVIFTTNQPTSTRLYTLAHNPAYRNGMTLKGYMQSHCVDYYLGHGMTKPSKPKIRYTD